MNVIKNNDISVILVNITVRSNVVDSNPEANAKTICSVKIKERMIINIRKIVKILKRFDVKASACSLDLLL